MIPLSGPHLARTSPLARTATTSLQAPAPSAPPTHAPRTRPFPSLIAMPPSLWLDRETSRVTAPTKRSTAISTTRTRGCVSDARPHLNGLHSHPDQRGTWLLLLGDPAAALNRYLTSETALIPLSMVWMETSEDCAATNHRVDDRSTMRSKRVLARIVMTALGVGLGFVIGGIGIAAMGTAIGIPAFAVMLVLGWLGWRVGRRLDRWLS